jgi:hypothetical protein
MAATECGLNAPAGPPKADIWIPDSQMDCFVDKNDFRQLGLILSECQFFRKSFGS